MLGKEIELETDHKPLIPLLGKRSLDLLHVPPRVLSVLSEVDAVSV